MGKRSQATNGADGLSMRPELPMFFMNCCYARELYLEVIKMFYFLYHPITLSPRVPRPPGALRLE